MPVSKYTNWALLVFTTGQFLGKLAECIWSLVNVGWSSLLLTLTFSFSFSVLLQLNSISEVAETKKT